MTLMTAANGNNFFVMVGYPYAELEAISSLSDDEIDTSDIPPLDETFWKVAERGKFYKPVKKQVTVRVDADVLAWLKSEGSGYQTRMNNILRKAMLKKVS